MQQTTLHHATKVAVQKRNSPADFRLIELLIDAGVDLNSTDYNGHTPLYEGSMRDEVGKFLQAKGGAH